ncbi:MAG: CvpA family protein [Verrucomicrobiales bacterium]|nr:CvpA family protein [Verrucomicrobiales bacterium]
MSFNWFDFVVLIVIGIGVFRGRQRGMSEELLGLLEWLTIVVVSALAYQPIGKMIAHSADMTLLMAYVAAYLLSVLGVKFFFSWIRRVVGEKLVGSDLFGSAEFYLGMMAGAVRCGSVLLVILALLHSKNVTSEQLARQAKMQQDNFGDISFPTFGSVRQSIFFGSLSGRFIARHLSDQLIKPTSAGEKLVAQESLRTRRQRELDEVFGSKK